MMAADRQLELAVIALENLREKEILADLNARTTKAFEATGAERAYLLDFNARLVTELREAKVWPKRRSAKHECDISDD